uniref:Uncharacterized protein n=1 Tax=Setaria viridis TaxID=4556 RepID=A0A4U6VV59_SETVI|nr:hypothetical protein SEVIR_2G182850v2 [Setaria viridis]
MRMEEIRLSYNILIEFHVMINAFFGFYIIRMSRILARKYPSFFR